MQERGKPGDRQLPWYSNLVARLCYAIDSPEDLCFRKSEDRSEVERADRTLVGCRARPTLHVASKAGRAERRVSSVFSTLGIADFLCPDLNLEWLPRTNCLSSVGRKGRSTKRKGLSLYASRKEDNVQTLVL
jgi:hypothetical protein